MRNVKAIFKKQAKSTLKSPEILIQFIIFPGLAFLMTLLMDVDTEIYGLTQYIIDAMNANMPNMVTMQATIFAGMALIPVLAGIIAEDIERKSLRFLQMAGMKPLSYLIGVSSVVFIAGVLSSMAFSWIADFQGLDFWIFTGAMAAAVIGSIMLGATIGIMTVDQQAAQALALPAALVLGFGPMMAQFNDTIARFLHIFFTQQLNIIADYLNGQAVDTPLWQSFAIIGANIVVLAVIFALVYRRKGVKA